MFITFEGLDLSGKSTQAKLLHHYFEKNNIKSTLLREPGGTVISEKIRKILLDKEHLEMFPLTEFLLFSAARSQLVDEVIKPALKKGVIVLCDRYYDSSTAYQGYGGNLDMRKVFAVNDFATSGLKPDITFFFDLNPAEAFKRHQKRGSSKDRMEAKNLKFYNKVYKGYKELARKHKRFVIIDGSKSVDQIHKQILKIVKKTCPERLPDAGRKPKGKQPFREIGTRGLDYNLKL
jgi:dTMP kinase